MAFVQFSKVSLAFGDRDILKDVSLHLTAGSRACLAGANGSGKSTLMKVLAGELPADSGDRAVQRGTRISYLPQSGIVHRGKSLRDEAETAFAHIHELIDKADKIAALLQDAKSDDAASKALLEDHHRLQEQIEDSGYYRRGAEISSVLGGFGFSPNDLDRDTGEFSGGWQMRIALAKALLERPDILLLDEPTNYLDIEARAWLEVWLAKFPGGCLLVSHDRYFLDVTVNEVYEIFQGSLKRYAGNYSAYEKTRQQELAGLMKRYAEQQEEIAKTEALIRRFRYKASKAAFAQELIKRLEKMERIEIPENLKKININFPPPPHSPRIAFTIEGLGKSYGTKKVLHGLDLSIDSGERLVVAGPNGAGKTTLLRILAGNDNDYEGSIKFGSGISAGYFSQDAAEALNGSEQVIEFMEANAPMALVPKLRDMLGAFLFRGDDVYKPVSVLSGGEKSRLALLYMLLKPLNLLILDEPTNHLDLHSKDVLLETLNQFKGTIIFVSHDRAFMEALSTKTLELSPGEGAAAARARLFYGGYGYYLEKKLGMRNEELGRGGAEDAELMFGGLAGSCLEKTGSKDAERGRGESTALSRVYEACDNAGAPRMAAVSQIKREGFSLSGGRIEENSIQKSAKEQRALNKQRQAELRRQQKQETELLNIIEELENEKARLEAELSLPEVYSNGEKARAVKKKLDECVAAIKSKTEAWETLAAIRN